MMTPYELLLERVAESGLDSTGIYDTCQRLGPAVNRHFGRTVVEVVEEGLLRVHCPFGGEPFEMPTRWWVADDGETMLTRDHRDEVLSVHGGDRAAFVEAMEQLTFPSRRVVKECIDRIRDWESVSLEGGRDESRERLSQWIATQMKGKQVTNQMLLVSQCDARPSVPFDEACRWFEWDGLDERTIEDRWNWMRKDCNKKLTPFGFKLSKNGDSISLIGGT